MKGIFLVALSAVILLLAAGQVARAAPLSDLRDLQWQQRIILVDETHQRYEAEQLLQTLKYDVDDRDIIWFVLQPQSILSNQSILTNYEGALSPQFQARIKAQYALQPGTVVLIGKDGGVKQRLNYPDFKQLFAEIDRMPMRISEMQSRRTD